ncbi:IclR family transcriptional regulator [Amorphus orientalis]|uniref:DNA-binding IclR family transcriptional regulator n=1 Tax=Amorphus orientalis TaxID=649198 RepID=A0AAE3VR80_9HYPH|nr:IclR family transcriptional regulator [Amorphus orientalis]MDQ0316847.1 DNA-binding IclR family transcriptional regulator [Amorphus orientalis]
MAGDSPGPIERYLQILEIVAASTRGLTLTDISGLTGLPKATAHRLTRSLVEAGALATDDTWHKTFRVGDRMWRMLQLGANPAATAGFAQIILDELAERFHETCYVVRLGRDNVRSIARSAPDQGHRLHVLPGEVLPPHAAASAKAILAYQPDDVVDRFLKEPFEKMTSRTVTSPSEVRAELRKIREQGFAVCDREIDDNVMAYACPIHMKSAGVIYSLGLTGPCTRLRQHPQDMWIAALKDAADRLAHMFDTQSETVGTS